MALWHKGFRAAVGKMPKVIDPHARRLDYAVAGSFLLMGVRFWKRSSARLSARCSAAERPSRTSFD